MGQEKTECPLEWIEQKGVGAGFERFGRSYKWVVVEPCKIGVFQGLPEVHAGQHFPHVLLPVESEEKGEDEVEDGEEGGVLVPHGWWEGKTIYITTVVQKK